MILNWLQRFRERGWTPIDAASYAAAWQRFGGSVATHPAVVERLATLVDIPVRYLGWLEDGELKAAVPTWGRHLALSKEVLKQRGKRAIFDLGNSEVILPVAADACVPLRHKARYVSELNAGRISTLREQPEGLVMACAPEEHGKKFLSGQRRKLRQLEEAGGMLRPLRELPTLEQAAIYTELFERRWNFAVPGKAHLVEVFTLLREFMTGSVVYVNDEPVAIQILYQAESPGWLSVEYINGGVDPRWYELSPGSVLMFANTQNAWAEARALGKPLRYSFGRADREYKERWGQRVPVYQV